MKEPASTDDPSDPLDTLIEEYFALVRVGAPADVDQFARRIPGREREFKELVETLRVLETASSGKRGGEAPDRERLGRFRLLRKIGSGGMGVVYEAVDETLDRRVALKVLPGHATLDEREVARFQREAHAAGRLRHPHIVPIFGVGEDDGSHWIAMQLVDGESVAQLLARTRSASEGGGRPLPPADVVRHAIAVADALACAHAEGILHRDVKPSNLLVDRDGEIWVTDFGLAKSEGSATITRTGETVGTPRYMAPESFAGWADPRTDLWGLGATLYEMLAGSPAFDGAERPELLKQISDLEPLPLHRRDPAIPRDLATIVHKCLRKEPAARYGSARELADDLRRLAAGETIRARPPSVAYRAGLIVRRHPTATTLLVVALAGGVAASWSEAARAHAAEARARARFDDVRRLAGSFLFEIHDAIRNLPGSTQARELIVKRALEYLDRLSVESADDPALRRELATAYRKVGDVQGNPYQSNLGDLAGARRSYETAIGLMEPLVAAGTATNEDRAELAAAELTGGGIVVMEGDAKGAVAMSEKGLALRRLLAAARPDAARRQDLATALQFHAFNLGAAERTDDAIAALAEQASLLDGLLANAPDDAMLRRRSGQNRYLIAHALKKKGDRTGARAAFDDAIEIQERLVDEDPGNTLLRKDLGWSCNDYGSFLSAIGEEAAALRSFEGALAISEALAAADSKSVDARVSLATAHENVGDTLLELDRPDDALVHLDEARTRCQALVEDDPSNSFVRQLLANVYVSLGRVKSVRSDPAALTEARDDFQRAVQLLHELKSAGRLLDASVPLIERAEKGVADCEARLGSGAARH
jgi:tetratricopeptide (TPR) repeat protein